MINRGDKSIRKKVTRLKVFRVKFHKFQYCFNIFMCRFGVRFTNKPPVVTEVVNNVWFTDSQLSSTFSTDVRGDFLHSQIINYIGPQVYGKLWLLDDINTKWINGKILILLLWISICKKNIFLHKNYNKHFISNLKINNM